MSEELPPRGTPRYFNQTYARGQSAVELAVEREVYGANVGVRGYTTIEQAELLAESLQLGPGKRLLDIGAGRGWPGLYLAEQNGCAAVLTDVPRTALTQALARASAKALEGRTACVQASGAALPFRARSFDAVVHTDVL